MVRYKIGSKFNSKKLKTCTNYDDINSAPDPEQENPIVI